MPTIERNITHTLTISPAVAARGGRVAFSINWGCPQCDSRKSVKSCSLCSKFPFGLRHTYRLEADILPNDKAGRIINIPNVIGNRNIAVTLEIASVIEPKKATPTKPKTTAKPPISFKNAKIRAIAIAGFIKFPFIPRDKNLFFFVALIVIAMFNGYAAYGIATLMLSLCFYGWLFRMFGRFLFGAGGTSGGRGAYRQPSSYCTRCGHDLSNYGACYCQQRGEQTTSTPTNPNASGTTSNKTGAAPIFHSRNYGMGSNVHPSDMAAASYGSRGLEADYTAAGRHADASAEASRRHDAERNDRMNQDAARQARDDADRRDKDRRDQEERDRRQY